MKRFSIAPSSIAGRLALMFAVATSLVSIFAGVAMFGFQSLELRRHQAEELNARMEIIDAMIRHAGDPNRWPLLADKLRSFTPANGSVRYRVDCEDARFRFMPDDALAAAPDGVSLIQFDGKRFMTLSRRVPPYLERPEARLVIAADTAPFDASRLVLGVGVLAGSLATIALVSLLGWWIARRGLAPVGGLSRRAGTLNPDDPSLRMPVQDLPDELVGLMNAFNGALDRLQEAYGRLSAFNADVAHELRTPLGNLIGQTQVALSRPRETGELEEVLHSNLEELERLRTIINDMLFMARADQGALAANLTPLSLAALTHKTADFLDILFEDAAVDLEVRGDARVVVDAALLGRAVTNLLDNAIRHGVDGKVVRVTIETQDEAVCFSVRNRGGPIPEAHLARLFDRFYRLDRAREHSGEVHGLGLAVVKAIVAMHGGSVFARCEDGEVLIGFLLPRAAPVVVDDGRVVAVPPLEREAVDA
ncbi:heavy metal sensor histidine kinase [Caulobacter sp. RHG1]|uniref:heavy metal sensor histidine kinase n=1 Tax=Caulobacter sp. (strain RHG1) TaxID=2545762 RepID=UPI00188539BE|nr:heavy metal sensor histidine kinase [Caulobacter sp. RHG1]NQE61318.1 Two-component system sensor histidine kinase [Caulobacter sp. RHG1]